MTTPPIKWYLCLTENGCFIFWRRRMKKFTSVINKAFDIIEVYIPSVIFLVVFVFYVIMIGYRYIFYAQLSSIFEMSMILFMWCGILAAAYGERSGKHILFTIAYDKFSEKGKLISRVIADLIILCAFVILIPYSYESINFLEVQKTSIMKIPVNIIYFPFLIFVFLILIHHLASLVKDIRLVITVLKGRKKI